MLIQDVKKIKNPYDRLAYWITEREKIRINKQFDQKPWTDDEILQNYRFCNVRRMDDKVSSWLLKNWYRPYIDHPNMVQACTLARIFNLPTTLDLITKSVFYQEGVNFNAIKTCLKKIRNQQPIFNGAYIVSTNGKKVDKLDYVLNIASYVQDSDMDPSNWKTTWQNLQKREGIGSFMAGQITADLRWAVHGLWSERFYFAPMGPGSRRGMNRLLGRDPNHKMNQEEFEEHFKDYKHIIYLKIPDLIKRFVVSGHQLEAIDYQNCLCEFDKYERVLWGEGRPKQKYLGA